MQVFRMKGSAKDLIWGSSIKDMRAAWQNMCVRAGLGRWICLPCWKKNKTETDSPADGEKCEQCGKKANSRTRTYRGLIPHDMRRSAARALRAAGVPENVVMEMGGWKTRAMFDRYAIVSSADQQAAVDSLEQWRAAQAAKAAAEEEKAEQAARATADMLERAQVTGRPV